MANTRERRTKQEHALLQCGEFFRDETLIFGDEHLPPRLAGKFAELRKLCFNALGNPSLKDADEIRAHYAKLAEESRV